MYTIECSFQVSSLLSTTIQDIETLLDLYECSYRFSYEFDEKRKSTKTPRTHCILSIDWYDDEETMTLLLQKLKHVTHIHVETCFDMETHTMRYMSTYYGKAHNHRKYQDKNVYKSLPV